MSKITLNKIFLLSAVLLFSIVIFTLLSFSGDSKAKAKVSLGETQEQLQAIQPPTIPVEISFANEMAPLEFFYVRESLDREILVNTFWHSSTILLLKRANRWFPIIEPILKENNIPDDFKYLALIESGFTKVVSPKGAAGYWQFLGKTAKEHGLEVNTYVDERYNVEKATKAACDYFHESYEVYKNWTLVAASYNAGKRRITESLEKQKTKSYYQLYLNEETSRYVFRILAIKNIYENYEGYGFLLTENDFYPPLKTKTIEVNQAIDDLVNFALEHKMNYRLLKELNPWLKAASLPNSSGKEYHIKTLAE